MDQSLAFNVSPMKAISQEDFDAMLAKAFEGRCWLLKTGYLKSPRLVKRKNEETYRDLHRSLQWLSAHEANGESKSPCQA